MTKEILQAQIIALRTQGEAMVATCDALLYAIGSLESGGKGDSDPAKCEHPKDQRKKQPTFGKPDAWICLACRYTSEELKTDGNSGT